MIGNTLQRPERISRRALLKRGALLGAAGVATGLSTRPAALARTQFDATVLSGLSGEITVSFNQNPVLDPSIAKAVAAVRAANPGAKVNVDVRHESGSSYLLKLLLAIRAGNAPDVFLANNVAAGALAAGGAIAPLNSYTQAWPDWAFYPQQVRDAVIYQGHVTGIPYELDTHYLYFRRDIFQKAGLAANWTPANVADILAAARDVKAKAPDVIPYALYAGENGGTGTAVAGFVPVLFAYGGTFKDANGKWIIDSCAVRETLAYYAQAYQQDKTVPQQVITTPGVTSVMPAKLAQGKLALLCEDGAAYGTWLAQNPAAAKEQIGYLLMPTANGGPPFTVASPGDLWYISSACKHKDLAWEFIKTWNTRQTVIDVCTRDAQPAARTDARDAIVAQNKGFLAFAAATLDRARFNPPDPNYQQIITILYDVTGSIATGQMGATDAVKAYGENLQRVLGAANVVRQPCA